MKKIDPEKLTTIKAGTKNNGGRFGPNNTGTNLISSAAFAAGSGD